MPKYKIRIRKAICTMIRKATVQTEKKFSNIFNKHFDRSTIVYCVVDTVYTVVTLLPGISSVICEAAC